MNNLPSEIRESKFPCAAQQRVEFSDPYRDMKFTEMPSLPALGIVSGWWLCPWGQ
jgi:hypothetical protein